MPITTGATVSTTSSATPATPSTGGSAPPMGKGTETTETMEQIIGRITMADPGDAPGERGHMPIISMIFSLSTAGEAEEPEEQKTELEYVSTITKDFKMYDPKGTLTGQDLQIKKEIIEEDLHPGDPEYYPRLQSVYQRLQKAEEVVEASKGTKRYNDNLKHCHSINQIFENMKTAYIHHAECTGKVLPEGWDTVNLAKPISPRGAKGMQVPVEEDPNYHPVPIKHLNPKTMGLKQIEKYMIMFDKEVKEINKIREKGTAREYTRAKMDRREELENKLAEFEIEKEDRLANRGGSKITEDPEEEEDPEGQGQLKSPWDQTKPKKGTYSSVGPRGPGDLNVEGDWEGPIELFEFEYEDEGWVCCTPGYYWHPVLGGGIYQHEDEWYRNWEFDYEPLEEEIVPEEPEDIEKENPKIPQDPSKEGTSGKQTQSVEENPPTTPQQTSA